MAQRTITHRCGHDETHQLYGKYSARDEKAEWLETTLCPACYAEQLKEERAVENADAAKHNAAYDFAPLEGSEKQIAWAESIRKGYVAVIDQFAYTGKDQMREDQQAALVDYIAHLKAKTSASWWIDHRDESWNADVKKWMLKNRLDACKKVPA